MFNGIKKILHLSRYYILISVALFFASILGGIFFVNLFPENANSYVGAIQEHLGFVNNLSSLQLALFLFINNSVKTFLFAVMGILFTVPTVIFVTFNGLVFGFVVAVMYPSLGATGLFYSLFFHGVFELTAIFIASGIGLFLGATAIKEIGFKVFSKNVVSTVKQSTVFKEHFLPAIHTVLIISIPLLIISAVIETVMLNALK